MKGQGYRPGYLAAGVFAVSIVAFGWTTQWAPARDAITPKVEKQWLSEEQQVEQGKAVMERIRAEGLPTIVREELERPQTLLNARKVLKDSIITEPGERPIRVIRARSEPVAGDGISALATGGSVGPGGACTCDSQCAGATVCSVTGAACTGTIGTQGSCPVANLCVVGVATQCRVSHCIGGMCVQENAPVDTVCNFPAESPALFCTEDRCSDAGVCVDTRAAVGGTARISPCSKQCCTTSACTTGSFQHCVEAGNCPGTEGCFLKRQVDGATTYVAQCNETLDQCFVSTSAAPTVPIGRCCSAGGVCSETTAAACVGNWVRWTDPDDSLHFCTSSLGCPKYSSGVAPVDDPALQVAVGPVVPFPRRCVIGLGLCEVDEDCAYRCDAGSSLGQACDFDADCPGGGMCVAPGQVGGDDCAVDAEECQTANTITTLGDDYTVSNGSYLRLSEFRFRGGVSEPKEQVVFEFYDSSFAPPRLVNAFAVRFNNPGMADYNIQVDCSPNCDLSQLPETLGE